MSARSGVAQVELTIEPEPSYVRTARQVAVAVARRAGVAEATLEEVRLAVSEATGLLLRLGPEGTERVRLGFVDDDLGFLVRVSSAVRLPTGAAATHLASSSRTTDDDEPLPVPAVLAVLDELASSVQVHSGDDGVLVELRWDLAAA
jgi:Histidine kinase-like ATPase domain